nr:hypothetical protein [Plesiomonas shigelloides]
MKVYPSLLILFFSFSTSAKTVIPKTFIPANSILINEATGDLNNDGLIDLAFIVEEISQRNDRQFDEFGNEIKLNPRKVMVLISKEGGYEDAVSSNYTIPGFNYYNNDTMDCMSPSVKIKKGLLFITLYHYKSSGTWNADNSIFTFKHEKQNNIKLIGYDFYNFSRATKIRYSGISVNYVSKKIKQYSALSANDETKIKSTWSKLDKDIHLNISDIEFQCDFDNKTKSCSWNVL